MNGKPSSRIQYSLHEAERASIVDTFPNSSMVYLVTCKLNQRAGPHSPPPPQTNPDRPCAELFPAACPTPGKSSSRRDTVNATPPACLQSENVMSRCVRKYKMWNRKMGKLCDQRKSANLVRQTLGSTAAGLSEQVSPLLLWEKIED